MRRRLLFYHGVLFSFLMFFITLLKHTPISEAVLLASVQKVIPDSLSSLISTWLNESFEASTTILSATVISALWAGSKGFASIAYELEAIYSDGLDKHRSFFFKAFSFHLRYRFVYNYDYYQLNSSCFWQPDYPVD